MFACFLALCVSYDFPDAGNGALTRVAIFFLCWKLEYLLCLCLNVSNLFTFEDRRGSSNPRASHLTKSTYPWDLRKGKEGLSPGVWFPSSFTLTPDIIKFIGIKYQHKFFCSQRKDGKIKNPLPISLGNSDYHWQAFVYPIMTLILLILAWQAKFLWFQLLELNTLSWAGGNLPCTLFFS